MTFGPLGAPARRAIALLSLAAATLVATDANAQSTKKAVKAKTPAKNTTAVTPGANLQYYMRSSTNFNPYAAEPAGRFAQILKHNRR